MVLKTGLCLLVAFWHIAWCLAESCSELLCSPAASLIFVLQLKEKVLKVQTICYLSQKCRHSCRSLCLLNMFNILSLREKHVKSIFYFFLQ